MKLNGICCVSAQSENRSYESDINFTDTAAVQMNVLFCNEPLCMMSSFTFGTCKVLL